MWTDGSLEPYPSAGISVVSACLFLLAPELAMQGAILVEVKEYGDAWSGRCCAFMPVLGRLQTVQRAEFRSTIMVLQAYWPGHLGVDNINVVRSIARLLDHGSFTAPLPKIKDGDLSAIVQHMTLARGPDTVRITKVKCLPRWLM